jgi:signal transduction histidine kinase
VGLEGQRFSPETETTIFRVVQEALTNAMKHAGAARVQVLVALREAQLLALVEDDGRGFDPEAPPGGDALGLIGVRERLALVGGTLQVESAPGKGTRVWARVPV